MSEQKVTDTLKDVVNNPDKVLKLDKDLTVEEVEEFFKDSDSDDDYSQDDIDSNFEILDEPTEAEKEIFKEDMQKFKEDVQQERQRYQPSTREKLLK